MVKSGIVVNVDRSSNIGMIEDKNAQVWFFTIHECYEGTMPQVYDFVTFVRDRDYKQTLVAALVKRARDPGYLNKVG